MEQYIKPTTNYVVDSTATSLGEGQTVSVDYPCDNEGAMDMGEDKKVGDHSEMNS